jgi:hypothetical protein
LTLRFVDQNLGGFGSELRGNAHIGYLTDLSAEYYRLLAPSGYFLEPRARILREPVYIWANQKRIAERFQENLEAGLEAGRTISNQLQISAEWRADRHSLEPADRHGRRALSERDGADRSTAHQPRQSILRRHLTQRLPHVGLCWGALPRRRQ